MGLAERMVGEVLRKNRIRERMTIKDLADELGVTPAYVSDIERGIQPLPQELMDRWIEAVNVLGEKKGTRNADQC